MQQQVAHIDRSTVDVIEVEAADSDALLLPSRRHRHAASSPAVSDIPAQNKILFLDGLRGLAALMVVEYHCGFLLLDTGAPAVDTFFVLSAFLLTMGFENKARVLLREHASYRSWGWTLLDYGVRRFLRVYPLFALTAVFLSLQTPETRKKVFYVLNPDQFSLFKVLTFEWSNRYFVFWTLPLEIGYYFMIPPMVVAMLKLGSRWWVPLAPLTCFIVYAGFTWFRMYSQPLGPHLPTFLTGSVAAFVYTRAYRWIQTHGFEFRWYHILIVRSIELVLVLLIFSMQFDGLAYNWFISNPVPQMIDGSRFIHGNVAVIIVCELLLPGPISSMLEWSLLRYAGKTSFSMYLLHGFVVHDSRLWRQPVYDRFFSIWILTFLIAIVSYHLIEVPCLAVASRIGRAIKAREAAERRDSIQKPVLPLRCFAVPMKST